MFRRRGRPPHPDILTPRQWEVMGYLRAGLSDAQIAERMSVSLAGAKYHVSEILSKLGVSSREEAAAWSRKPRRQPVWSRALAIAAAVGALGLLAGVAVLALGVASGGEGEEGTYVSRDAAIIIAGGQYRNDDTISSFDIEWLAPGDAAREAAAINASVPASRGAWRARVVFNTSDGLPPATPCSGHTIYIPDEERPRLATSVGDVPAPCPPLQELSRDNHVYQMGIFLSWRSGSPAPQIEYVEELAPSEAAQRVGLETIRPYPSGLADPNAGPGAELYRNVFLTRITAELPIREPQTTAQWEEDPMLRCQDLYFGLKFWPVIDEATPSDDCS